MNLLFCINQHYLTPFMITLGSLARFSSENHVYIFHRDLDLSMQEQIIAAFPQMDFHFQVILEEQLPYFPTTARYPLEIYYRLYAAHFLPTTIDRILYLDADTLIINPLDQLYHVDFQGNYFAGCTHIRRLLRKFNHWRLRDHHDAAYINTGVLMINLEKLREIPVAQDIACFMKQRRVLWLPDQDIISSLYGKHILLLDSFRYNLSDRILTIYNIEHAQHKRDLTWVSQHTAVIHFCGKQKPWQKHYRGKLKYFYQQYTNERR